MSFDDFRACGSAVADSLKRLNVFSNSVCHERRAAYHSRFVVCAKCKDRLPLWQERPIAPRPRQSKTHHGVDSKGALLSKHQNDVVAKRAVDAFGTCAVE